MDLSRTIARWRAAIRNVLRRQAVEKTLDDELRTYVELLVVEKVREGMAPDAARRAALIESGGVEQVKEDVRDARAGAWIESLARDVSHTMRGLRRTPGFTLAVIATLAIGIGLNTALFTLMYSVLARPLPIREPDRVVNVYQRMHSGGPHGRDVYGNPALLSYEEYLEYARASSFAATAVYHEMSLSVTDGGGREARGEVTSCGYFRTLRVRIALGRDFTDDECSTVGGAPSVVLSDAMWRSEYGGDSSIVGRVIHVNGQSLRVIGVAERGFNGIALQRASMWLPITLEPALDHTEDSLIVRKNTSWLVMVARLAPSATLDRANAEAAVIARRLDAMLPGRHVTPSVTAAALVNFPEVGNKGAIPIALTMLLGFSIVAMACANVMGLLLARGLARRREIAIRLAIGASRGQLVRQLLIESGTLAAIGTAAGMALLLMLPRVFAVLAPVTDLQLDLSPDASIVKYAFGIAVAATVLFGLTPALQTTAVDLASTFKGTSALGRRRLRPSRIRAWVVGVQMAGSAMLLVVGGLFLRGTTRAVSADPGYLTHNIVALSTNAAALGYDTARANAAYTQLLDRIRATPGVVAVGLTHFMPLLRTTGTTIYGERGPQDSVARQTSYATVNGSYFEAMGMRIVRGVTFDSTASRTSEFPVVVSGSLGAKLWGAGDPLGKRIKWGGHWHRVIGIASDAAVSSLSDRAEPVVYFPVGSALGAEIVMRTSGSPAALMVAAPSWAHAVDRSLSVQSEKFEDRIALALLPGHLVAAVTGMLGTLALLLAAIGIAGVVSFSVGQRRHELAVRLAIGATAREVVVLMMRQGARPLIVGGAVGIVIAGGLGQLIRGLLYGVSPLDPLAYLVIIAVIGMAGVVATYVPSRRAALIDPAVTLRDEA